MSEPTPPPARRPAPGPKTPAGEEPTCVGAALEPPATSADPPRPDFLAPDDAGGLGRLGPYRVLQLLGQGGMGMVFLAEDPALHRRVALKVMLPAHAKKPAARERFMREGRATAQIEHDHIVTIYQVGEDRGVPYLAMQLLRGRSLEDWLAAGNRPTLRQAVRIAREVALGLAAAHDRGLIHRDIKPANVWLEVRDTEGASRSRGSAVGVTTPTPLPALSRPLGTFHRAKILDFGLARPANEETNLTQEGTILGTPSYMAPEQAFGRTVDARADLFSLGCVLYRLTTGALPFTGTETMAVLMALVSDPPRPARVLNPDVPPALADLVHALLAKEPADRPASARAVAEALLAIERSLAMPPAPPASPPAPAPVPERPAAIDVELVPLPPRPSRALRRPPERPRRRLWPVAVVLLLFAVLSAAVPLGLLAMFADQGTVVVRPADDAARAALASTALHVITAGTGHDRALALGSQPLPSGQYAVDPASVPAGVRVEPVAFQVTRGEEIALVARSAAPAAEGRPPAPPRRPPFALAPFDAEAARQHQEAWASYLQRAVVEANPLGLKLVLVPPGEFEMGSTDDGFQRYAAELKKTARLNLPEQLLHRPHAEGPAHRVRIHRPFRLGAHEVTVGQFRAFVQATGYVTDAERFKGGTGLAEPDKAAKGLLPAAEREVRRTEYTWQKPGFAVTDQHPVSNVTAHDAQEFCRWLSQRDHRPYRLPTEAEWEYACRAGTTMAWSTGDAVPLKGSPGMWTFANAKGHGHVVGQWAANPFGLYDMHGNVAELCLDNFDPDYYAGAPADDPRGPVDRGKGRAVRGGGFAQPPMLARAAFRTGSAGPLLVTPSVQVGFRVVCELPPGLAKTNAKH